MKVMMIVFCLGFYFQAVAANAAYVRCTYQAAPCDDKGDHYHCTMYGWAEGEFCSATDVSHRPLIGGHDHDGQTDEVTVGLSQPAQTGCFAKISDGPRNLQAIRLLIPSSIGPSGQFQGTLQLSWADGADAGTDQYGMPRLYPTLLGNLSCAQQPDKSYFCLQTLQKGEAEAHYTIAIDQNLKSAVVTEAVDLTVTGVSLTATCRPL